MKTLPNDLRITTPLKLKFKHEVKYLESQNQYEWQVYVDEEPAILGRIQQVEYLLDTAPMVSTDSANRFATVILGGKQLDLHITVIFKNGTKLHCK